MPEDSDPESGPSRAVGSSSANPAVLRLEIHRGEIPRGEIPRGDVHAVADCPSRSEGVPPRKGGGGLSTVRPSAVSSKDFEINIFAITELAIGEIFFKKKMKIKKNVLAINKIEKETLKKID